MLSFLALAAAAAAAPRPIPTATQARAWSVASTAVGYASLVGILSTDSAVLYSTAAGGVLLGPSAGHLRSGDWARAGLGVGIRSAAVAGVVISGVAFTEHCFTPPSTEPVEPAGWRDPCGNSTAEVLLGMSSLVALGTSSVLDMVDAGRAPARVQQRRRTSLAIHPQGIILSGHF